MIEEVDRSLNEASRREGGERENALAWNNTLIS